MTGFSVIDHRLCYEGKPVPFRQSPNVGGVISPRFIVEHHTGGYPHGRGSVNWLCNPAARASAHIIIAHAGDITQLVPFNIKAWHAGSETSRFKGMSPNSHSIGIELANPGRLDEVAPGKFSREDHNEVYDGVEWDVQWYESSFDRGHYIPFSDMSLDLNAKINRALIAAYPEIADVTTHQICDPARKVDPHPGFDLGAMQTASGIGVEAPDSRPALTITTGNTVSIAYKWPSYETPIAKIAPETPLPVSKYGTYTNIVDDYHDTSVWYECQLPEIGAGWINENSVKV